MMDGAAICLGCCFDHQSPSRAEDFEHHPSRDLFDQTAGVTRKPVPELRRICLRHQEELLGADLESGEVDEEAATRDIELIRRRLRVVV